MKYLIIILILQISGCSYSQSVNKGIINNPKTDINFGKGSKEIKASIKENISNLNLYEYSFSLNELYILMNSREISKKNWNNYIDTLLFEIKKEKNDTIRPFYATDYKGIIPFQAEYLISSLDKNKELKKKYPNEYNVLKNSTSKLIGLGYSNAEIDSLIVFFPVNSTIGTENFWYFLQVKTCYILDLAITKIGKDNLKMLVRNLDVNSTYKRPFYLQMRKFRHLYKNINECNMAEVKLNGSIMKFDDEKDFFKSALKEGFDMDKMRSF